MRIEGGDRSATRRRSIGLAFEADEPVVRLAVHHRGVRGTVALNALGEMVLAAAGRSWSRPAVADPSTALESGALVDSARAEARALQRLAGRRAPVVAVCLPLGTDALVQVVAAILGDHTVCLLDPAAPAERRAAVLTELLPDVVVSPDGREAVHHREESPARAAAPGYVAMSSGSTGARPKGVLTPWSAIAAFAPAGAAALEVDTDSVWAEISHPAYDMAMTNLLLALASGAAVQVSPTLGDRLRPLRFLGRVGATHVRMAPRFVDLAVAERAGAGAPTLRVWGSGGDRLHAVHVERLFALGVRTVVNTYGTSETIGFASAARLTAADPLPVAQGSVPIGAGRVGDWHADLVDHGVGQMLTISSPHLPHGYLFGPPGDFPRWETGSGVLTGDVGARAGENLFCLGRSGRRVKRSGSFVDLDEIDAVIRATCHVVSFTLGTRGGDLVSLVEGCDVDHARLVRALAPVLRPEWLPDRVLEVRQLPRLGNGKVDHVAAEALADPPQETAQCQ